MIVLSENILITGGAGYIGSHVIKQLLEFTDHKVTVLDNFSTGSHKTISTLKKIKNFDFIEADLKEFSRIRQILENKKFNTIIHFAASIVVPESIENPLKYYLNNTVNTINLIKSAIENNVKKFIFSSTAAVYGEPESIPDSGIDEFAKTNPISPYGMSKLMSEKVIIDTAKSEKDFKYIIFRYFNVAGADTLNNFNKQVNLLPRIGQSFPNATHLIKIASECAVGKRNKMYIFGSDYPTKDGTCIRDYIHIDDLASAHVKAIDYLDDNNSDIFNLGYGKGFSVKEVIDTMKKVTGIDFDVEIGERRSGDPAILVADSSKYKKSFAKIQTKNGKVFNYDNLELICRSAYEWEKKNHVKL